MTAVGVLGFVAAVAWISCSAPPEASSQKSLRLTVTPQLNIPRRQPFTIVAKATDENGRPGVGEVRFRVDEGAFGALDAGVRDTSVALSGGEATVTGICDDSCSPRVSLLATWEGEVMNWTLFLAAPDGGAGGGTGDAGVDGGDVPIDAGTFSPGSMFLLGTLQPGSAGRDVVCDLATPHVALAGVPDTIAPASRVGRPTISPLDGRLYYRSDDGTLLRFQADKIYVNNTTGTYPTTPEANDPVIATPGCADGGNGLLFLFLIKPNGDIVHRCPSTTQWLDSAGQPEDTCAEVESFSAEGASFCRKVGGVTVLSDAGEFPVTNGDDLFVVRNRPGGGFWGVTVGTNARYERWTVSLDGGMTLDGQYAAAPGGFTPINADVPGWGNIDSAGNFYRWGGPGDGGFSDVIARFSADFSSSSIIYDEATATTVCKFHGSNLITGP